MRSANHLVLIISLMSVVIICMAAAVANLVITGNRANRSERRAAFMCGYRAAQVQEAVRWIGHNTVPLDATCQAMQNELVAMGLKVLP